MKFLTDLFRSKPQASTTGSLSYDTIVDIMSGGVSSSGVHVSYSSAQAVAAVFACIRVLSQTVAGLSLGVFEQTKDGSKPLLEDPLYGLLHDSPNENMTSFVWREILMQELLTKSDHVTVIQRNGAGRAVGFFPIPFERVTLHFNGTKRIFKVQTSKGFEAFEQSDVLHFPCFSEEGIRGRSMILNFGKETIGQAIATQNHTSKYFENGAMLGATLETPNSIEPARQKELLTAFKENYMGNDNAHKVAILVQDLKFKPVTLNNKDAQLIENRKYQISDIARLFGVPPHKIGIMDQATFSNIEHQSIEFVQYSLMPWLKRIEQEINRKLFSGTKKYVRFNIDTLLRGDFATRSEGYSKALASGWMTPNEVRSLENLNRIPGGDTLRVPLNTAPIDQPNPTEKN